MKLRKNQSEVLNPKQKQAISELTRQDNNSLQEVAKKVGISIATLYRWRKKPEFSTALEESFRELKEEVESKEAASTYKQSLVSNLRCYYNLQRISDIETMILINVLELIPTIIEYRNKFETKDKDMNTKLKDLKKNLIDIERDINKMRKEIETQAFLLE